MTDARAFCHGAREAAGDGDVSIQGGANTVNQYLAAGTRLFDGVPPLNLEQVSSRATSSITHVTYRVLS